MACGCLRGILTASLVAATTAVNGQQPLRRVTTVAALKSFPAFFHSQQVLVRGELQVSETRAMLVSPDDTIAVFSRNLPDAGTYDVRGDVLDIGKLQPDDPRLSGIDLARVGVDPSERWPRQGEVVVLRATAFEEAAPLPAPSIRAIALDPDRYEGQNVTVAGQFRGRNLYGDLPQAPVEAAETRAEFVLRSADAAIWVLGKHPKGRGFEFDVSSRIDTRRWLEVQGLVRHARGLAWIDAKELREIDPQPERPAAESRPAPAPPIPPEVLFSAPTEGETDVTVDTRVRIQFSRDLDPSSLKARVRASYVGGESVERGEPQPPTLEASVSYDRGLRVLELQFAQPLGRFRTVKIDLLEGITGTDGAPLQPWTLTFSVGG
jgi:hypothetical protein